MNYIKSLDSIKEHLAIRNIKIEFESDVQICEFFAEHRLGVTVYENIENPSSADERWVAQCFIVCGMPERALEHFMKAIKNKNYCASIDLARLLAVLGRIDEAQNEIENLDEKHLDGYNKALYYRTKSYINYVKSETKEALINLNKSWRLVQGIPEFVLIAPKILISLAEIYTILSNREMALYYIKRAEEICITKMIWSFKSSRVLMLSETGSIDEAENISKMIIKECDISQYIAFSNIMLAIIQLARKDIEKGKHYFNIALKIAKENMFYNYEVIISGYLAKIYHHQNKKYESKLYINRMKTISQSDINLYIYRLRKNSIENSPNYTLIKKEFMDILKFRENWKDVAEIIRVLMYICDIMIKCNDSELDYYISKLMNMFVEYQSIYYCCEEWIFLENLERYLSSKYNEMLPNYKNLNNKNITIHSIGREDIIFNGKILKLPLKKSFELIVYLIMNNNSNLESILADVFSDIPKNRAKNQFHQIKHSLSSKGFIIKIAFDKYSHRYYVVSEYHIDLDIKSYIDRNEKIVGVLLPSSGSDWVLELNQRLSE